MSNPHPAAEPVRALYRGDLLAFLDELLAARDANEIDAMLDAALEAAGWCERCEATREVRGVNPGSYVRCPECKPVPDVLATWKESEDR